MNNTIDNFLSQQTQELQLEKQRLYGGDSGAAPNDGLDADNDGAGGDNNDADASGNCEKLKKEALNHALTGGEPDDSSSNSGRKHFQQQDPQFNGESFYSHFPSFSNQNKQREQLAHNRHQEYRDHLSKIAQKEATETKRKQQLKQDYDDDHKDGAGSVYENPISGPYSNHHQLQNPDDSPKHTAPGSPYDHKDMLDGLKHSSTVDDNQQTAGIIKDSNEEYAQEAARKKMEYQRDLMKQIEDKKQEVKALRAREKAEEEQMTKRLEEQLKSIQLEEQLRRERKRSEQARITSEQNHIYRLHLLAKLDTEARQSPSRPPERTAHSDTGKSPLPWSRHGDANNRKSNQSDDDNDDEVFDTFDPRKAYKYFSNSAQPPPHQRSEKITPPPKPVQAFHEQKRPSPSDSQHTDADYCKRCLGNMRNNSTITVATVCNYCERRRHNLPINEDFCLKCSVQLATHTERQNGLCAHCRRTDLRCGYCQKHIDVCPTCSAVFCLRCHRRQLRNVDEDDVVAPATGNEENVWPPPHRLVLPTPPRPLRSQRESSYDDDRAIVTRTRDTAAAACLQPPSSRTYAGTPNDNSDSEHELPPSPVFLRHDAHKPISTNVPQSSIFHPKACIDAPKLAVNIRHGQLYIDEHPASKYSTSYDSFPVPLMPPTSKPVAHRTTPKREPQPPSGAAVRMLQKKWEIPVVQRNLMSTRPNANTPREPQRVLTQLGAIRRQLQLEQMELDDTHH